MNTADHIAYVLTQGLRKRRRYCTQEIRDMAPDWKVTTKELEEALFDRGWAKKSDHHGGFVWVPATILEKKIKEEEEMSKPTNQEPPGALKLASVLSHLVAPVAGTQLLEVNVVTTEECATDGDPDDIQNGFTITVKHFLPF